MVKIPEMAIDSWVPAHRTTLTDREVRPVVEVVSDVRRLPEFELRWRQLESAFPNAVNYDDFYDAVVSLSASDHLRLIVIRRDDAVIGIAPFVLRSSLKKYTIAERRLFSLPILTYSLMGCDFLGEVSPGIIAAILEALLRSEDGEFIELRDIAHAGRIHSALTNTNTRHIIWRNRARKLARHWLIDLPSSMEEYYQQMSQTTRAKLRRKYRGILESQRGSVILVTAVEQIDWFLSVAEEISRKTYQWDLGQRILNDAMTRQRLKKLAENRRLRCYVLVLDGVPCALIGGTLARDAFRYEMTGYDPQFAKDSPGTALLLYVVKDLISHTSCRVFDFGEGGDTTGYKSLFGNRSYSSLTVDVASRTRIYSRLLLALQDGLNLLKNIGSTVIPKNRAMTALRRRLKSRGAPNSSTRASSCSHRCNRQMIRADVD